MTKDKKILIIGLLITTLLFSGCSNENNINKNDCGYKELKVYNNITKTYQCVINTGLVTIYPIDTNNTNNKENKKNG